MNVIDWAKYFRYRPGMIDVAASEWRKRKGNGLLGVAVFGCGGGGIMHTSHYLWHPETEVLAVFDPDPARFSDLDVRFPFMHPSHRRYSDVDAALQDPRIDIVSVCTPDHTHADYVVRALEAGKHVLCEKPLATTVEDCQRILAAVQRSGKVCAVFQQMRFVPRNARVKQLVDDGSLGEIFHIETGYIHDMRDRATLFSQWRMDPSSFQHPIFGGIHHIDLLRWIAGDVTEVHTVAARKGLPGYPTDDTYVTSLRLSNGGIGQVLTCFGPRVPREFHPLKVHGTGGTVYDDHVYLERNGHMHTEVIPSAAYRGIPQFRKQISHFVDCVRGRATVMVTPQDGARSVAVAWAAIESQRTGQPVTVPALQ